MRKAHVLKGNRKSSFPVRVIFFDTETEPISISDDAVEHKFKLGWACYWERRKKRGKDTVEWYEITDPETFWEWVDSKVHKNTRVYLVAHNIDFDLGVLQGYDAILKRGYKLIKSWERGLARFFKWKREKETLVGIDNNNIFPGKLENLGKSLNLPKLQVDFDKTSREALSVYCKRDVEIMLKAWQRWIEFCQSEDLGCFGYTIAGQSFNAFRHRFMKDKIYIHNHEEALKLERSCYKGGRCEAFYIGIPEEEEFFYLDVNSMYPSVMIKEKYPVKLVHYERNCSLSFLKEKVKDYLVCAHVRVKIDFPAFPVKVKEKTFYPVGEFDCFLSTPEILFALRRGKILKVYSVAFYEGREIFSDYVRYFYSRRLEAKERGDKTQQYFFKLMLNSLYGKFGQKSVGWEKIGECDPSIEEYETVVDSGTGKRYTIRKHNGIIEQTKQPEESFNSFPAIAAHVTAYARMYLFSLIEMAGIENVFYTDTDSLITNRRGYENLKSMIDPKELGKLKLEARTDYLEIRGAKDYIFGDIVKVKGVRSCAVKVAANVFIQEKWCGFSTRLREGKLNTYIVKKQKKTLRREYAKGKIGERGRVMPWKLPEDWEKLFSVL